MLAIETYGCVKNANGKQFWQQIYVHFFLMFSRFGDRVYKRVLSAVVT